MSEGSEIESKSSISQSKHKQRECAICGKIEGTHWLLHLKRKHLNRAIKERVPGEPLEEPHSNPQSSQFVRGRNLNCGKFKYESELDAQSEYPRSKKLYGIERMTLKRQKLDHRIIDGITIF